MIKRFALITAFLALSGAVPATAATATIAQIRANPSSYAASS
jgi:hypothetical protein